MKIIIADNYKSMSETAAKLVIAEIKKNKSLVLTLPSGRTPIGFYANLVKAVKRQEVSFREVKFFQLDEYVGLPKLNRQSYYFFLKDKFFKGVDLKEENIFMLDRQAENLEQACANHDQQINRAGGLDLAVLGLGLNGHAAFNEPGSDFNSKTRVVKLARETRLANAKAFGGLNKTPRQAATMGLETIMKARKIILIASGDHKAAIIKRALYGAVTRSAPASILQKHKNLTVIFDKAAAGDLTAGRPAERR